MERLTEKREDGYDYARDERGYCFLSERQLVNKLGQLEDIEEELGIDLRLRHEVETSEKLYCKDDKGNLIVTRYIHSNGKKGIGLLLPLEHEPYCCVVNYDWKDYGKTWALTKEQLENQEMIKKGFLTDKPNF